ncbi:MAG: hypothetical protein OQK53_05845 [Rhodospirillales bacterium]|nr:hypothetical protein [Rhodospirillales bacterium]
MSGGEHKIHPVFGYRVTNDEIIEWYGGAEAAFAAGDYMLAATNAPANSEIKGAALVLSGLFVKGAKILDALSDLSDQGLVIRALAHWIAGENEQAIKRLEQVPDDKGRASELASRLEALIGRDRINVFKVISAVPIHFEEYPFHRSVECRVGPFVVCNISGQLAETFGGYDINDPLDEFIAALPEEQRPDFLYCQSPQWILPRNFEKIDIPKVMWCNDSDVYLQANLDNYLLHDVHITNASQEHFELGCASGVKGVTVFTFDPTAVPFPEVHWTGEKDIDVLFTGDALNGHFKDRARFLYHLARLSGERHIRIENGHLPKDDYRRLLERSRFLPLINRYLGMPSPRWRDALSAGAFLLSPRGSFFDEVGPGSFPVDERHLTNDVRSHLEAYDRSRKKQEGVYDPEKATEGIREALSNTGTVEELAERQLKYAAFFAATVGLEGIDRRSADVKRRIVWLCPRADLHIWGEEHVKKRISKVIENLDQNESWDEKDFNNAATTCGKASVVWPDPKEESEKRLQQCERYLEDGRHRFPDSLALRFNACYWRFVRETHFQQNLRPETILEWERLLEDFDNLSFDPVGTDIGAGIASEHPDIVFPYIEYAWLVTETATAESLNQKQPTYTPRDCLRGAVEGFIGLGTLVASKEADVDASMAALPHLLRADEIYPGNVQLKALLIHTLTFLATQDDSDDYRRRLIDVYFDMVNIDPMFLLNKEIYIVVDCCLRLGKEDVARALLGEWYGLARCVRLAKKFGGIGEYDEADDRLLMVAKLLHFSPYYPRALLEKINRWMAEGFDASLLSTFECDIVAVLAFFGQLPSDAVPDWDSYQDVFERIRPHLMTREK